MLDLYGLRSRRCIQKGPPSHVVMVCLSALRFSSETAWLPSSGSCQCSRLWLSYGPCNSAAHPGAHVPACPCPQGGAQCPGLGLPWSPTAALLLAGAVGRALAARPCPDTLHGEPLPQVCALHPTHRLLSLSTTTILDTSLAISEPPGYYCHSA